MSVWGGCCIGDIPEPAFSEESMEGAHQRASERLSALRGYGTTVLLGFETPELVLFLLISLLLCITVCSLAMESVVLFVPAFLFFFPAMFESFPALSPNEAIGLAFIVVFFGYSSSVSGYWYRRQIDFTIAAKILLITIPLGILARLVSYVVPEGGLVVVFGLLLIGLSAVIYRYHPAAERTCLLCGDAFIGMQYLGGKEPDTDEEVDDPDLKTDGSGQYTPRTRLLSAEGSAPFPLSWSDRAIVGFGGGFAGLVGVAIGEVSNTFLTCRKRIPVQISTGTSALVLYLTMMAVLATNLVVIALDPPLLETATVEVPWRIGVVIGGIVIIGGQIGAYLNSKASDRTIVRTLIAVYFLVGLFVIAEYLFR